MERWQNYLSRHDLPRMFFALSVGCAAFLAVFCVRTWADGRPDHQLSVAVGKVDGSGVFSIGLAIVSVCLVLSSYRPWGVILAKITGVVSGFAVWYLAIDMAFRTPQGGFSDDLWGAMLLVLVAGLLQLMHFAPRAQQIVDREFTKCVAKEVGQELKVVRDDNEVLNIKIDLLVAELYSLRLELGQASGAPYPSESWSRPGFGQRVVALIRRFRSVCRWKRD